MALKKCGDCEKEISDAAFSCPQCGRPGYKKTISAAIADIEMPFFSMVVFMVKWVIATIPALIILAVIAALIFDLLGGLPNN